MRARYPLGRTVGWLWLALAIMNMREKRSSMIDEIHRSFSSRKWLSKKHHFIGWHLRHFALTLLEINRALPMTIGYLPRLCSPLRIALVYFRDHQPRWQ